jgi:transcription initiation factor IIF auxiliary subunit
MLEDFKIQQWEKYEGEDWWRWAVWVEAPDEVLDLVDFVEWTLHPTFPDPIRKSHDRAHKFRIETGGWGVFQIIARVQTKDGKQTKLHYHLELHYPDGSQTKE